MEVRLTIGRAESELVTYWVAHEGPFAGKLSLSVNRLLDEVQQVL